MPNVCAENGRPIHMVGKTKLKIKLGHYRLMLESIVCESLAAPLLLDDGFCDNFFVVIRPRYRKVELTTATAVPILRDPDAAYPR